MSLGESSAKRGLPGHGLCTLWRVREEGISKEPAFSLHNVHSLQVTAGVYVLTGISFGPEHGFLFSLLDDSQVRAGRGHRVENGGGARGYFLGLPAGDR